MKQYLLGLLLLLSSSISHAETKATIGGLISSNDTANLTLGFDHTVENGPWQSVIETDYFFSEQKNIVSRNRGFFSGKQNYSLDERNYVFVVGRYEFDKLRTPDEKVIAGAGYGYKLIRTSKVKLSNEVSLGTLKDRYDFEPVVRNSIWLTYNVDSKLTFTNKFLIEQGTDTGLSTATFASGSYNNNNLIIVNGALRRPSYLTSRAATDLTAYAPGYSANPSSITITGTKTFNRKFNLGASVVAKIVVSVTGDDIIYSGSGANKLVFKFVSPDTSGLETFTAIEGSSILQGAMPSTRTSHGTDTFTINLGSSNIPANSWFAIQIESADTWTGYISQLSVAIG